MNKIIYPIQLILCLLLVATTLSAAPEAEYRKLSKTWTVTADGSQEYHHSMELTLFTHTAMNNTYGESFIVYNPDYQTVVIHSAYTTQKDGSVVKTPDNAFVEVLPRFAAVLSTFPIKILKYLLLFLCIFVCVPYLCRNSIRESGDSGGRTY